jgi:hypothetical protein
MIFFATLALVLAGDPVDAPTEVSAAALGDAFASGVDVGSDIDGDGVRDLLVFDAGQRGKRPGVWIVSGKRGAPLRALPAHPGTIVRDACFVGDVDGDHVSDFVITVESSDGMTSWFAISAASGKMLCKKARGPKDTALIPLGWVGDVDGDGVREQACREVELVHARHGPERIRFVSGNTGEPVCAVDVAQPLGAKVFDAGDVDLDGSADVAVPVLYDGRASVGVYSCRLSRWLWIASGDEHDVQFGRCVLGGRDVDGDGVPDIVSVSDTVGIDLDGDGTIDAIETVEVTGVDLDGDGTLDEIEVTEISTTPDDL